MSHTRLISSSTLGPGSIPLPSSTGFRKATLASLGLAGGLLPLLACGTSLQEAAGKGDVAVVDQRLREGADVNAIDESGKTALHKAAEGGHKDVVGLLLQHGGDARLKSHGGCDAFMAACDSGNLELVQLLFGAGVDIDAKCDTGGKVANGASTGGSTTALMVAASRGNPSVVSFLLSKGADVNARNALGLSAWMLALEHNRNGEPGDMRGIAREIISRRTVASGDPATIIFPRPLYLESIDSKPSERRAYLASRGTGQGVGFLPINNVNDYRILTGFVEQLPAGPHTLGFSYFQPFSAGHAIGEQVSTRSTFLSGRVYLASSVLGKANKWSVTIEDLSADISGVTDTRQPGLSATGH
jgi:ankyrin repeat protein